MRESPVGSRAGNHHESAQLRLFTMIGVSGSTSRMAVVSSAAKTFQSISVPSICACTSSGSNSPSGSISVLTCGSTIRL